MLAALVLLVPRALRAADWRRSSAVDPLRFPAGSWRDIAVSRSASGVVCPSDLSRVPSLASSRRRLCKA